MSGDAALRASLEGMGLVGRGERLALHPLAGGVSSDIRLAETPKGRFCVKRALPRLKVAAVWEAPVSRGASEAAWLREAARLSPGLAPRVLGEDRAAGLFAMEYLDPAAHPVWKTELLAGRTAPELAALVGERMGRLHAATARDRAFAEAFATDDLFEALRLEPYLRATAGSHPDLAGRLLELADRTATTRLTLVHGDLSPKNILVGAGGPVVLDAECAWFGDPAFDLAFCLNHLALKTIHLPAARAGLLASFDALAASYLARVDWEPPGDLEERAATLLPALLLARIDGKSPVEYLDEPARSAVRRAAHGLLIVSPRTLTEFKRRFVSAHA